jgi:hypothetical protein
MQRQSNVEISWRYLVNSTKVVKELVELLIFSGEVKCS